MITHALAWIDFRARAAAFLIGVIALLAVAPAATVAGDRPDINTFSASARAVLYDLMTDYITREVILEHTQPPPGAHGSWRFLVWHRNYLKGMEDYLISRNHPEFVPLPKWDPATRIPDEFFFQVGSTTVRGGVDPDCPTDVFQGHNCNVLVNNNPNIQLPASLSTLLGAQGANFCATLESYHNPVHGAVGGAMSQFKSPAAPIFWLWHAFVDDVWFDWQCVHGRSEGAVFDQYTPAERITDLQSGIADAWTRDSDEDVGSEPNFDTQELWKSKDIWVRNTRATRVGPTGWGTTRYLDEHQHENPEYSSTPSQTPYVYVKVRNRGCTTVEGRVRVYFTSPSIGFIWGPGGHFTEVTSTLPVERVVLPAGSEHVVEFQWENIRAPTAANGGLFCMVARFEADPASSDPITGEVLGGPLGLSLENSNQFVAKNLKIVDNFVGKRFVTFVRNISSAGDRVALRFTVPGVSAQNFLVDPSFEANPLMSHIAVLGSFVANQGIWGVERATISGPDGAVSPPNGDKMLRMTDAGGHSTQAFQVTDVTPHATLIDSGLATFDLMASFNADVPAASAGVGLHFFDEPVWGSPISSTSNGLVLDSDAATWQTVSVSGGIPPGTRWIVSEVNYPNSTISPEPGYVDEVSLVVADARARNFFAHGRIHLEMPPALFQRWLTDGGRGEGIEIDPVRGTVSALRAGATIEHLPIAPGEEHLVALTFEEGLAPCESEHTVFHLDVAGYEGETLLGGNSYEIRPTAFRPNPTASVIAEGPQINCTGTPLNLRAETASPGEVISYLWLLDGLPLAGASERFLTATRSGRYSVIIGYRNGCNSVSAELPVIIDLPPHNDDACAAMPLDLGQMAHFNLYCATAQPGEATPGVGSGPDSCQARDGWCESDPDVQNSVWYSFIAPASGAVSIHGGHGHGAHDGANTQLAVWRTTNCADFGAYRLIAANDDSGDSGVFGTGAALHELGGLVPGVEYLVHVDGYQGSLGSGMLVIEEFHPACYADCDDSGDLDFFDFLCFQNAFAAGEPYADCDESGSLDFFDFLCFQNEFAAGCS